MVWQCGYDQVSRICCAGYPGDVDHVGRRELQAFFEQHYGPQALTIAIVGDIAVEQVCC